MHRHLPDPRPPGFRLTKSTFFEEQARHRRRTLRFAVFTVFAIALTGIPVSLIVTPLLYLVILTGAHLIQLVTPLPSAFWELIGSAGQLIPAAVDPVDAGMNRGDWSMLDWLALGRLGLVLVAPGMAAMLLLWVWVRALLWHAGSGGVLLSIGAREPNQRDLEERQLVNLIEEMAIAAGIPPPAVRILDQPEPNAAAVGRGPRDATIVVTRGLLDKLDRDQTQGILAHAMATIVNGDLRIAMLLLSVNQTFGLLAVVLHAGSARKARRILWESIKGLLVRDDRAAAQVAELLAGDHQFDPGGGRQGCLATFKLPFVLAAVTTQFLIMIGQMILFGPFLGAMWRARRFLADATAVQLTRNPNGLAHALEVFSRHQVSFERGDPSGFFFVHWARTSVAHGPSDPIGGWHPKLAKRLHRLEKVGARLQRAGGAARPVRGNILVRAFLGLLTVIMYLTLAVGIVVMLFAAAFTMTMTLAMLGAALWAIQAFFTVLPDLVHWIRYDSVRTIKQIYQAVRELSSASR